MADGRRGSGAPTSARAAALAARIAAAVVLVGVGLLALLYLRLNGNLHGIDIDGALGKDRPRDVDDGSLDLLILGSDSRTGDNRRYGGDGEVGQTARSDTAMVVHVHRGHRRATVVSIPRDTLVDRPACRRTTKGPGKGTTQPPATRSMFNEAYKIGGPVCSVKTVEALTGIRMDHYIEIDFTGFKRLVDALGGVTVTTKEPIHDRRSRLLLGAGTHHLDGEHALGFVRTRHGTGDGSDLGRIALQQRFIAGLLTQVRTTGLLESPTKLYRVADAATRAITTDSGIDSVKDLMDLTGSLKGLRTQDLDTVMLPVDYDDIDPNRVVPKEPEAEHVWSALRADQPVPRSAVDAGVGEAASAARGAAPGTGSARPSTAPVLDPMPR